MVELWAEWTSEEGQPAELRIEVDWSRRVATVAIRSKAGTAEARLEVGADGAHGSHVVEAATMRPRGLWWVASPFLRTAIRREADRSRARLERSVERAVASPVPPADVPAELGGPTCIGRATWEG